MNVQFAETLKKLRNEKGLTQLQLANLMFVNKSTVGRWETGVRLPDAAIDRDHADQSCGYDTTPDAAFP